MYERGMIGGMLLLFLSTVQMPTAWAMMRDTLRMGGDAPLHRAAREGDLVRLRRLLPKPSFWQRVRGQPHPDLVRVLGLHNLFRETPLYVAVSSNRPAVTRLLLELGSDANTQNTCHRVTPLLAAVHTGSVQITKDLLDYGANVELSGHAIRDTPLHSAALLGHEGVVQVLLEGGARADARGFAGRVPLQHALFNQELDNVGVISLLLAHGAAVRGEYLNTAVRRNNIHAVELLLAHNAHTE